MIEVKSLTKTYIIDRQVITAVDNVSFKIKRGELVSIAGHSGSGKTTLLSLMGGLIKPDSGTILISDKNIWSMDDNSMSGFRNKKISFIYQFSSLIPTLTSLENVMLPAAFGNYDKDAEEYSRELLNIVRLNDKLDAYPSCLSGGQQRRVAIARAFINSPDVILADEPTGDLDEDSEKEILTLFHRMNKEEGITFIIATHNNYIASQAGRQLRMSNGAITELQGNQSR